MGTFHRYSIKHRSYKIVLVHPLWDKDKKQEGKHHKHVESHKSKAPRKTG